MTNNSQLNAEIRTDNGKGASRRLRADNKIPAVIYGGGKDPQSLTLKHNEVIKAMENADFRSQILAINVNGKSEQVVLKDIMHHPYKPKILHMDFMRIKATEKITMLIPLHFIGGDKAPGVKAGGIVSHAISEVEVRCLPADLPRYIEVDLSNLELNDILHLSDLKMPKNVDLPILAHGEQYNQAVATVHMARIAEEITPAKAPEEAAAAAEVKEAAPATEKKE